MSYPYPPRRPAGRSGFRGRFRADTGIPGPTALDRFVERFRHRWETEPQYRTTVSAGCGASALLALCVVVALAATVANAALGGTSSSGSGAGLLGSSASGGVIAGQPQFPTNTVPVWTPGQLPNAVVAPTSATSPPSQSSPTPTATSTVDGTPTPTSGGLPTTCNGNVGNVTWAFDKCPEVAGQGGSFTVTAPGWANAPIYIIVSFGSCTNGVKCTVLFDPSQYHLNGQATITVSFTVPAEAAHNVAPMSGEVQVSNGGPSFSYQAAPVQ